MARPRHAERRRVPVIAAVAIAVVVAAIVTLAVRFWPDSTTSTAASTGSESSAATEPTDSATSPTTDPSASASAAAAAARATLKNCITRVRSTDEVLNQAAIGIHNWTLHVQAQTDADQGKISVMRMNRTFKKTKAEGPDDVERYAKAKQQRQAVGDACDSQPGAPAAVTKKLTSCQERIAAQEKALKPAEVAMQDWHHHLMDMSRSASGQVSGPAAEKVWVNAYRAAPKHLKPYESATSTVNSAPTCT